MTISSEKIGFRKAWLATILGAVLTYSALLQVDENLQLENYVKFALFILLLPGLLKLNHETAGIRQTSLVEKLVYLQIGLIILGYFFADLTAQIGNMVGFHVSSKHEFILSRAPFDPWKRSFSIFDNPNIAARLLVLTFLYYASISSKLRLTMLILVLTAIVATGSRAALVVFFGFCIWAAVFHRGQRGLFRILILSVISAVSIWVIYSSIRLRIFDVITMMASLSVKGEIAARAFSNTAEITVYDTDIALIYHQFGAGGLLVLLVLILQTLNLQRNLTILACAYCLSGSLLFSTPNIAILLLLRFIGRPRWHTLR